MHINVDLRFRLFSHELESENKPSLKHNRIEISRRKKLLASTIPGIFVSLYERFYVSYIQDTSSLTISTSYTGSFLLRAV